MGNEVREIPREFTAALVPIVTRMRSRHGSEDGDNGNVTGKAAEKVVHEEPSEQVPFRLAIKNSETEGVLNPAACRRPARRGSSRRFFPGPRAERYETAIRGSSSGKRP